MALRDSRQSRRRLFLFTLSIVFGVAALVAINAFGKVLERAIETRSKTLLGADLLIASGQPFNERTEELIRSLGGDQSRQTRFASMARFPKTGDSRLVAVRGLKGGFPYYGELETDPAGVTVNGRSDAVAIVDDSLMAQFGLEVGDTLEVGKVTFEIIARLIQIPGETAVEGVFSPRVYVPHNQIEQTELIQIGSIAYYNVLFRFDSGLTPEMLERLEAEREEWMREARVWFDTIEERKQEAGRVLVNINSFLNLVGFIALLLGAVGIAGSVQVYLKGKVDTVAVLRCLGATNHDAMAIYCIQITLMGLIGTAIGAAFGLSLLLVLPKVMAPFLPIGGLDIFIAWPTVFMAMGFGWVFMILFSLIPLLPLRKITPLRAIRSFVQDVAPAHKDRGVWIVCSLIVLVTTGFALWQSRERPLHGLGFLGGILLALGLLWLLAFLLRFTVRRITGSTWPYVWRQGMSNLYRPNNRTLFLLTTLGIGSFLIFTLYLTEQSLLRQGELSSSDENPNLLMFDIQPDQNDGVNRIIEAEGYTVVGNAPVVTMNLAELNGYDVGQLREMDESGEIDIERWAVFREYQSTFREHLNPDEVLLEGSFTPRASLDDDVPIPVSVEKEIVRALDLKLGDRILFDVQGFPIDVEVTSIREVNWNELRPNFFVVFPAGVLEEAPAFYVTATQVPDQQRIAFLQRKIVETYPNVSAVNLEVVLQTVGEIFDRVTFVLRFMASFTIATGLVVLISSILTSRYQRVKESVLLRTLGAQGRQIRSIMAIEYVLLGSLSALAGIILAGISSFALSRWVFEVPFYFPWGAPLIMVVGVSLITLLTGLANSRGIASHPPLEILREEG